MLQKSYWLATLSLVCAFVAAPVFAEEPASISDAVAEAFSRESYDSDKARALLADAAKNRNLGVLKELLDAAEKNRDAVAEVLHFDGSDFQYYALAYYYAKLSATEKTPEALEEFARQFRVDARDSVAAASVATKTCCELARYDAELAKKLFYEIVDDFARSDVPERRRYANALCESAALLRPFAPSDANFDESLLSIPADLDAPGIRARLVELRLAYFAYGSLNEKIDPEIVNALTDATNELNRRAADDVNAKATTLNDVSQPLDAATASRSTVENVARADEADPSFEKILADPRFAIQDDATPKDVVHSASGLLYLFSSYETQSRDAYEKARRQDDLTTARRLVDERKANEDAFYKKLEEVFLPRLKAIVEDDEIVNSDNRTSRDALGLYLRLLVRAQKFDEIQPIHEKELDRLQTAQNSDNDDAPKQARERVYCVDFYYLNVYRLKDALKWFDSGSKIKYPKEVYDAVIEIGNKLVDELKRDPFLVINAGNCYRVLLQGGYDDEAVDLRDKYVQEVDQETALKAYLFKSDVVFSDRANALRNVVLYCEESIDKSIFETPENESDEFYQERERKIRANIPYYRSLPTPQSRIDELVGSAQVALLQISARLGRPTENDENASSRIDAIQYAVLTPQSAAFLRKAIDDESAKPFDEINAQFVDSARAALRAFELDEAIRSGDASAIADACARFVERADKSYVARERVFRDVKKYARSNPSVAETLLDNILDTADNSNGGFSFDVVKFRDLKESVAGRNP